MATRASLVLVLSGGGARPSHRSDRCSVGARDQADYIIGSIRITMPDPRDEHEVSEEQRERERRERERVLH